MHVLPPLTLLWFLTLESRGQEVTESFCGREVSMGIRLGWGEATMVSNSTLALHVDDMFRALPPAGHVYWYDCTLVDTLSL